MASNMDASIQHSNGGLTSSSTGSVNSPALRAQDDEKQEQDIIPNGGIKAWLQVFGAFLLFFNSWGVINTFGAYQTYYEFNLLQARSSSTISWIGTFQGFILITFSIVGGPIFDRGYFRHLIVGGSFFLVFGMMMTSLCSEYYQLFLAQGLCVGLGAGAIFLPSVAIVATYFTTKRALATGITAAGGSVGSVIYTIIFRKLQPRIGFAWSTRVIGFIALGCLIVSLAIMRSRAPPRSKTHQQARKMVDLSAFKSIPFLICIAGMFLAFIGLYIPFFYIIAYAETHANVTEDMSFYLLSIMNAASAFGRIIPGLLADRLGSVPVMAACTLASAVLIYAWIAINSLAGLIVFSILYGFVSGAVVSLPVTTVAFLVPDLSKVGTWMGMAFCFSGLGFLIGNPIAGTLTNVENDDYIRGIVFAASCVVAGGTVFSMLVGYLSFLKRKS
ncbi:major facilitator superfamily domain-containing protein [Talaromyces proteolyticus]|uniref:Major facilitator superfamily domain-containing protein n=1 Tax=Talaromyces proteolyticus TaxID=1131652 RepID=A0AAD4KQB4_9EURO|nr:major facilitator superfamily domain-containing protein [Talaromyces proteolyticus]KAH8697913.1 major facilitator superfamily domain-containing protein [Talaromyces proteolyticus]